MERIVPKRAEDILKRMNTWICIMVQIMIIIKLKRSIITAHSKSGIIIKYIFSVMDRNRGIYSWWVL